MPSFHPDMKCGVCGGPLEDDRNALCHTCEPESTWFKMAAAAQEVSECPDCGAVDCQVNH